MNTFAIPLFGAYTLIHLNDWVEAHRHHDEREGIEQGILNWMTEAPENVHYAMNEGWEAAERRAAGHIEKMHECIEMRDAEEREPSIWADDYA